LSDPTKISDVKVGMVVKIEETKNFDSGILVEGKIKEVLSKFHTQPHGVLVVLEDGRKGHTKNIINSSIELQSFQKSSFFLEPEGARVEYKESFVYTELLKTEPEKAWKVPHAVFKTIAAFANAEGGNLWIGIDDEAKPIGLKNDYELLDGIGRKDRDGFELKIKSKLKSYFRSNGKLALDLMAIEFPKIDDIEVCKIKMSTSTETPLILWEDNVQIAELKGPYFYVRKGNSSEPYEIVEFFQYWLRHIKAIHQFKT